MTISTRENTENSENSDKKLKYTEREVIKVDKKLKMGKSGLKIDKIKNNNILIYRPSPVESSKVEKNYGGKDLEQNCGWGNTESCTDTTTIYQTPGVPHRRLGDELRRDEQPERGRENS